MGADDETASTASLTSLPSSVSGGSSCSELVPATSAVPPELAPLTMTATATATAAQNTPSTRMTILRIPSQLRLAILSINREQLAWEEVEDDLYILLNGNVRHFDAFRSAYFRCGLHNSDILRSLAYLSSSTAADVAMHDEHVSRLAHFLCTGRAPERLKLAALRTLMTCLAPGPAAASLPGQDAGVDDTYEFVTTREAEWGLSADPATALVFYELRAKCLRTLDLERERVRRVTDRGDEAAVLIATGAKLVEFGIQKSNRVIGGHIDSAGRRVKDWVDVEHDPPPVVDRDAMGAVALSDSARRMSHYAQEGTKYLMGSICEATISGLQSVGNKFDDGNKFGEQIPPETREVLKAAGKVGLAAVGAVALVGEAIVETSRSVASKTAGVTADIVEHKYGTTAGKVAKNMGDTAGNVLRTMGNVALLGGSPLAKAVAKNVGKDQLDKDVEKVKETIRMVERHMTKLASETFGIEWNRKWIHEIEAAFAADNCREQASRPFLAHERDDAGMLASGEAQIYLGGAEGNKGGKLPNQSAAEDGFHGPLRLSSKEEQSSGETQHRSLATAQKSPRGRQPSSRGKISNNLSRQRYPSIQFV